MDGLRHLEYRGYDSAGVAIEGADSIDVVCCKGKVSALASLLERDPLSGTCGIGHPRWATHGKPTVANAHPHTSCSGEIAIVHNGIIENFAELKVELEAAGHRFSSDTDSEVIAHLIEDFYVRDIIEAAEDEAIEDAAGHRVEHHPGELGSHPSPLAMALQSATERLVGSYGIAAICRSEPGTIAVAAKDSPLIIGVDEKRHGHI